VTRLVDATSASRIGVTKAKTQAGGASSRYSLGRLLKHTEATRRSSAALRTSTEAQALAGAFGGFADELEKRPPTLVKNVSLLLTCRFMNHVYSAMLLLEAGLTADALTCERSALETLAAFRLVSLDGSYAQKYHDGKFPKPVEVRKLLEKAGDILGVRYIKDLYSAVRIPEPLERVFRRHLNGDSGRT
jgi:hypothetical protein